MEYKLWEKHWRYCRLLEQELDAMSVYIEFDQSNFNCYSLKLLRLINSAMAEFEIIGKEVCTSISNDKNIEKYNISKLRDVILKEFPDLVKTKARVVDMDFAFYPFDGWNTTSRLTWWDSYNKLKHDRNNYYDLANLQLAIESVAVLKIMTMILHKYSGSWMPATGWTLIEVQEIW